jgi:hypothetical protein
VRIRGGVKREGEESRPAFEGVLAPPAPAKFEGTNPALPPGVNPAADIMCCNGRPTSSQVEGRHGQDEKEPPQGLVSFDFTGFDLRFTSFIAQEAFFHSEALSILIEGG